MKTINAMFPTKAIKRIDDNTDAIITEVTGAASEATAQDQLDKLTDIELNTDFLHSDLTDVKADLATIKSGVLLGYNTVSYYRNYTDNPINNDNWVTLGAPSFAGKYVRIFDSSGEVLEVGIGGIGSQVPKFLVPPGGCELPFYLSSGDYIHIKRYNSVSLTNGIIVITIHD